MLAFIIVLSVILFFVLLALLPIRIRIYYGDSLSVFIPLLFFRINLYPKKRKMKSMSAKKFRELVSADNAKKKKQKKKPKASPDSQQPKKKLTFKQIKPLIGEITSHVGAIISKFSGHLRVKVYSLQAVISSDDAATTAITYGVVSGAASVLINLLHERCNVSFAHNARTGIYVDYTLGDCKFECDIRFTLRIWQIFSLAVSAAVAFIKTKSKLEENKNVGKQDQ